MWKAGGETWGWGDSGSFPFSRSLVQARRMQAMMGVRILDASSDGHRNTAPLPFSPCGHEI